VLSAQTILRPQARAHVLLCRRDVALAYGLLGDEDRLRCHRELPLRDAKQYGSLADFMNVTPTGGTQAAHRSLCMVHVAYRLRADGHARAPASSVLDRHAACRGSQYVEDTIQRRLEKPEPGLGAQILHQGTSFGRIHAAHPPCSLS
jgi:hypothetical protein